MANKTPTTPPPTSWWEHQYVIEYILLWIMVAIVVFIIIGPLGIGQAALNVLLSFAASF